MAEPTPQTYANHARYVTFYHFVSAPIFILNLIWAVYRLVTGFSPDAAIGALLAFCALCHLSLRAPTSR